MSKMKLYNAAEYLYVYKNIPIDKICEELKISRRTIFYWKKRYNWDLKHKNYIKTKNDFEKEVIATTKNLRTKKK